MRAPVLFHLWWRLRTIGCLPMFLFALIAYSTASGLLASAVEFAARHMGWPLDVWEFGRNSVPLTFGTGIALGIVFAWTTHELMACPITATLPRFRRRLALEALAFFAGASALLWIAWATRADPRSANIGCAYASVWFVGAGTGLLIANPGRFRRPLAGFSMCVAVIAAGWYADKALFWFFDHPWPGALLASLVGTAFTFAAFSKNDHRQLLSFAPVESGGPALDPRVLDTSFRVPDRRRLFAPTWNAPMERGRAWARGTLHDLHGAGMGGWIAHSLGWALSAAFLVCLLSLAPDGKPPFAPEVRWATLARNALTVGDRFWVVGLVWVVLATAWIASVPAIPRAEFVRPWSRAERADAIWKVCALRSGLMTGTLLVVVLVLGALAYSKSDIASRHAVTTSCVPDVVAVVLILAVLAPWVAWIRLRLLDLRAVHGGFPDSLWQAVVALLAIAVSLCAAYVLGAAWQSLKLVHVALAVTLFAGAVALSWLAFRSVLYGLFRRVDLRV